MAGQVHAFHDAPLNESGGQRKILPRFYGALGQLVARRAKADLFFLCKYILASDRFKAGFSLLDDEHHRPLCNDLMRMWTRKRYDGLKQGYVVEWPRGTMKSTIVCVGFPIWILLNDPNARILIDSEASNKSTNFLKAIKQHFESPLFHELFGVLYDPRSDWNNERLTLKRTITGMPEPSIDIGGVEKEKTGYHYDAILADDIVGKTNSGTLAQIQKVNDHAALYMPLLDITGLPVFSCTRWAFGDHGETMEEENNEAFLQAREQPYVINKLSAFKGADPEKMSVGEVFALEPEFKFLSRKYLMRALASLKPWAFYCQYLLHPKSPADATFKREWIKWIGKDCPDIPYGHVPDGATCYITVDPALSTKEGADYTAIVVAAIKPDFTIYILDVVRERMTDMEIYEKLVGLNEVYHPIQIAMEAVFKMKRILLYVKMQAQMRGYALPIKAIAGNITNKNKAVRIMGLQPIVQAGKFFMRRRVGDFVHLEDQMIKFNPARIDRQENDCLDSAAFLPEILNKPADKPATEFFDDPNWLQKLEDENKALASKGMEVKKVPSFALVRSLEWHKHKSKVKGKEKHVFLSTAMAS